MQPEFDADKAEMRSRGFDEVIARTWAPDTTLATHTHEFGLEALVVAGEMSLIVNGCTRHLKPGDTFALEAGVPHAERYGPTGATYWVARRHPA